MASRSFGLVALVLASACDRSAPSTSPEPAVTPARSQQPDGAGSDTFVSTSHNADRRSDATTSTPAARDPGYVVTSPEEAKQLAEAAIAERLDPRKTWKASPVLPSTWPATERAVWVFYYPMAANPHDLTHYQLFSPAWRVKVSLVDGATEVTPVAKSKHIGTVEDARPSSLERRELALAESTLVQQLLGDDLASGESPYWGYLEFMHEHPQLGRDLARRAPAFVAWVRQRNGK